MFALFLKENTTSAIGTIFMGHISSAELIAKNYISGEWPIDIIQPETNIPKNISWNFQGNM